MAQSLLVPALLYALMLLAPGYLLLRAARISQVLALCCAPIVSMGLVSVLGEAYAKLGIAATPVTVYAPLVLLPLACLAVLARKGGHGWRLWEHAGDELGPVTWLVPLACVAVGLVICNNLFVSELPAADAIMQNYDVQHHLNVIRSFYEARRISSLGVSFYESAADSAIMPYGTSSFYPSAWYGQCALLMQVAGVSAPVAINAALAVTMGLAYPLAVCAFALVVFEGSTEATLFTGVTCVGFATFPWCMLVFGPLYPNLAGFALLPACLVLCMLAIGEGVALRRRLCLGALALVALLGQALLHPNTVFATAALLFPLLVRTVYRIARRRGLTKFRSLAVVIVFAGVCLGLWVGVLSLPVLTPIVSYSWSRYAYSWQELINIVTQTYTLFYFYEITAQVLLGILVAIGFVRALYSPSVRWLAASYVLACAICFINATSYSMTLRRYFSGIWYNDALRVSALAIIVAAPLAGYGMEWVHAQACHLLEHHNGRLGRATHPRLAAVVLAASFMVLNFMPGFNWPGAHAESTELIEQYRMEGHEYDSMSVRTTFGDYRQVLRNAYAYSSPLDDHERVFLEEVRDIVGSDLVINDPYDGSALAYGAYGLRLYYRNPRGFGSDSEDERSVAIRGGLSDIATSPSVSTAVESVGARYVLQLDSAYAPVWYLDAQIEAAEFSGVTGVSPDTPGFVEVLSSGDCHLYRIEQAS